MFPSDVYLDELLLSFNTTMHNIPKGIDCHIYWNDAPETHLIRYISFGAPVIHEDDVICDEFLVDDEYIFYYLDSQETQHLLDAIGEYSASFSVNAEWTIDFTKPYEVLYQDSSNHNPL
jgi:hypothetical protein